MDDRKPEVKSDELDLNQLFIRIGNFFGRAWLRFMRFLATVRRTPYENKLSFFLIITASLVVGTAFTFFVRQSYYESKMILSCDYLNKRLVDNAIGKLDALAHETNKEGLARTLGLTDTLADNIVGFDVVPFVEEKDVVELEVLKEQLRNANNEASDEQVVNQVIRRIEIENRHAFEITVRTLNPSVIPNLQEAVVQYFEGNPYIKKRIEINRQNLASKQAKLKHDIDRLDSLKYVIYSNYKTMAEQTRGSNNVILSDKSVTDPIEIYDQGLEIYNQYQAVSELRYLHKDFEVVDGFTEFSEPASPSVATMLFYSFIIGIGVAYMDVALRKFNKYLASLK